MRWGRIPAISQYVLIFIAVTFTWLMGLMGYVRSGLRQHWHVYGIIRDQSVDAFTPTLGFATKVVSVTVLAFFLLIGGVFWIASLHDRPISSGGRKPGAPRPAGTRRGSGRAKVSARHEDPAHGPDRRPHPRDDRLLHLRRPAGAAKGSAAAEGDRYWAAI